MIKQVERFVTGRSVKSLLVAGLMACASFGAGLGGVAEAAPILLNTGQGSAGTNSIDPIWDVKYDLGAGLVTEDVKTIEGPGFPFPAWIADDATSHWVTPVSFTRDNAPPATPPAIDFTYFTTFTLTRAEAAMSALSGRWASDNNTVEIYLNGFAITPGSNAIGNSFSAWTTLTGNGAGHFLAGVNTLEFHVLNQPQGYANPSGFRFEGGVSPVPEPASLVMSALSTLALGGLSWKRRLARRAV